jgi:PAS domain S-box-containing protein
MNVKDAGWELLFWTLFERSTNPIGVLDDQLRLITLNEPALETLGHTRGFLIGRSSLDIVAESERTKAAEEWQALLRTGEASGDRTVLRSDGAPVLIEFAARLAMVDGQRLAVYVVKELREPPPAGQPSEPDAEALTPRERGVVTPEELVQECEQGFPTLMLPGPIRCRGELGHPCQGAGDCPPASPGRTHRRRHAQPNGILGVLHHVLFSGAEGLSKPAPMDDAVRRVVELPFARRAPDGLLEIVKRGPSFGSARTN